MTQETDRVGEFGVRAIKFTLGACAVLVALHVFSTDDDKAIAETGAIPSVTQASCDAVARSVARATGARVGEAIPSLGSISLNHSAVTEINIYCADGKGEAPVLGGGLVDAISFYTRNDPLASSFNSLVTNAGAALSGLGATEVRYTIEQCFRMLSASRIGTVYLNAGRFGFMCDGGPAWGRAYNISLQYAFPAAAVEAGG